MVRGTQLDAFPSGSGVKRTLARQYEVQVAPAGSLEIGGAGLDIKAGGVTSSKLAVGCVLGANVGFNDANVPNTSGIVGVSVRDAFNTVNASFGAYLKLDGTTPMVGNLNMANHRLIGMAAGTGPNDAVNLKQMQDAVALNIYWLHTCAYAGIGTANGALRPTFVRASQSVYISANPIAGNVISFDGASIQFVAGFPGANQCQIGGSPAVTASNLAVAINNATALTGTHATQLQTAVYAIRELSGSGQTIHIVWKDDDKPGRTPTTANGLLCSTSATGISFLTKDPSTANGAFYGAYDVITGGAMAQARQENAIYQFNEDTANWDMTYANPGTGYFSKLTGDIGGTQLAGTDTNLLVEGDTRAIKTTSWFGGGPRLLIEHKDASAETLAYHSETSVVLKSAYPEVGTLLNDRQDDFNGAADVIVGNLKSSALRNALVNGAFIADPVGGSPYALGPGGNIPCMPGWAARDNAGAGASISLDGGLPGPYIGLYDAKIVVAPGVSTVDFYQPILDPVMYSGKKIMFRAMVYGTVPAGARAYVKSSAGVLLGTALGAAGSWQELTVSTTLADPESLIEVGIRFGVSATYYVDACTCVMGAAFASIPFIARDFIDDDRAISAMYQVINNSQTVWTIIGPATAWFTVPFATRTLPGAVVTPVFLPGGDPFGGSFIALVSNDENSALVSITRAAGFPAVGNYQFSCTVDARPT